jgi:spermidine synthase
MTTDFALQCVEETWPGLTTRYDIREVLHEQRSGLQELQLVDSEAFGRMLVLDGYVQITERDEFIYQEMMTHVPMLTHAQPRSVLVIGGGDGGILREVLRHASVEEVTLVEIDRRVIDFSREHLPAISAGAFDDPRVTIEVADGAVFLAEARRTWDVIILDTSDPVGPATVLFTPEFYGDLARCLAPDGVLSRQTGSSFMQPDELAEQIALARAAFSQATGYVYAVPTYVGGFFTSLLASHERDLHEIDLHDLADRIRQLDGSLRYYTPGVHFGALQLPPYITERIDAIAGPAPADPARQREITFGWELQLDLYGCDIEAISTEKTIQRYARELCDVIDMKPYGPPQTPYFGENSEITKGYSLLQFIETSSLTGHFSEGTGAAYINIFSCKYYDRKLAAEFSKQFFGAERVAARFVTRK